MKADIIEFYVGYVEHPFASVQSAVRLVEGDLVNIKKVTYIVTDVTFALDHADDAALRQFRCNVTVKERTR